MVNNNHFVNPILPLDEYIPDGEPHVFGDRLYIFGSHDTEGGKRYCAEGNYVGWSASLNALNQWECAGIIYDASEDPDYLEGEFNDLYAPDVCRGNDGKYYLYYNFVNGKGGTGFYGRISVAVSDSPAGKYTYLGFVRKPDGTPYREYIMSDPAVINDDGQIRLYFGWSLSMVAASAHSQGRGMEGENKDRNSQMRQAQGAKAPAMPKPGSQEMKYALMPVYRMMFGRSEDEVKALEYPLMGANTIELEDDMLTVKGKTKRIVNGQFDTPVESSFFGHAFYEASSIRKINGKYYFIYSSENSNELCYAISDRPDEGFVYGGTIISNGDVGYHGLEGKDRHNMTANDHGSLECINGRWYIFHHRQTHKSTFGRQTCAERVEIKADGSIDQAECTSMGLSPEPLRTEGSYSAAVSCMLTNGHMPHITNTILEDRIPNITNDGEERFIADISDGTTAGYKYFKFDGRIRLTLTVRGDAAGKIIVGSDHGQMGEMAVTPHTEWKAISCEFEKNGTDALYLTFTGEGYLDLKELKFD